MIEAYIAYFDLLGFKDFILRNDSNEISRRFYHVMRDIEHSLGEGNFQPVRNSTLYADLSHSKLNCLCISDTIIFWTTDLDIENLKELLRVSFDFNRQMVLYNFPLRGVVLKGLLKYKSSIETNSQGSLFNLSSLMGIGIVEANIKSENLNWSGTVIDDSLFEDFNSRLEAEKVFEEYAKKYMVPYKSPPLNQGEEYVLRLSDQLDLESYANLSKTLIDVFQGDNRTIDHPGARQKMDNTLEYLKSFIN